ncbi:MAG TPA: phage baseplate assembly protein V [Gemmatimonadaceae bacterium]|jgi:uncharacterized protein involved in type VI secretion and phage assembly|nr:phage baseplate assembly protein V [Gemmatimonadaceae bacterium]
MAGLDQLHEAVLDVANAQRRAFYGKYRGTITDNDDPDQSGRVRVQVPQLFDDDETDWAMPCVPYAPAGHGAFVMPEVGDTVWVEFEAGDPSRPIWTGGWWTQGNAPALKPAQKQFETAGGQHLLLDDTSGAMQIEIKDGNGNTITLAASGITLARGGVKVEITDSSVSINDGAFMVMA